MACFEKPENVPGSNEENHDRTQDDRSLHRILNPGPPEYDVLVLTGDHSHIFVFSLNSPYPL